MKRREILKHAGVASPLVSLSELDEILDNLLDDVFATSGQDDISLEEMVSDYFDRMPAGENELNAEVVELASEICLVEQIPAAAFDSTVSEIQSTSRWKTRVEKTIDTLDKYGITQIESEWIDETWDTVDTAFRYVPLLGSLNELHVCSCNLKNKQTTENVESFYMAVLAFGIEVALFYIGAPFKMAWSSTRFISNRTILRLYGRGCGGVCLSLAMSEIHWAIRGQIYEQISVDKLSYIEKKLERLEAEMDEVEWRESDTNEREKFDFEFDDKNIESIDDLKENLRGMKPEDTCNNGWFPDFLC